jgi:SAM-dependent methyltransferase
MRLDPAAWALVHDRREVKDFAFWRGLELCTELCADRVRPGALWADVGSGTGHLASALAALGARVVGLDHDLNMARYACRRWSRPFAVSEAFRMPLADGSCSGVVAISLLGCLSDPSGFFAEAGRVLAPDGTLCISAMNRYSILLAASKAWSWRVSGRYTAYDPAALTAALRRAGLVPEREVLYGHFASGGRRIVPSPDTARRWERTVAPGSRTAWARQFLLIARRPRSTHEGGGPGTAGSS